MLFLNFIFWTLFYFCIGTFCLILFAKYWPSTYLEKRKDTEAWFTDVDAAARAWGVLLWPLILIVYILCKFHDLLSWLFKVSVSTEVNKLYPDLKKVQTDNQLQESLRLAQLEIDEHFIGKGQENLHGQAVEDELPVAVMEGTSDLLRQAVPDEVRSHGDKPRGGSRDELCHSLLKSSY